MAFHNKKFFLDIVLISFLVVVLLFLRGGHSKVTAGTNEIYEHIEIFTEVLRQVEKNYVEPQEARDLIYGAIKGMIQNLDPHSTFMTKEEHQELLMETKGSFSGVGIEITVRDKLLTVVSPIEGTPAFEAGIMPGDKIIKIDDKSSVEMSLPDAVKIIRGPKGTDVKLTVMREGEDKPLEFNITRAEIPLRSVKHYQLTPEIGYVRISSFQANTEKDLSTALEEIETGRKLKGLILDLRSNPGGLLSQAIAVSEMFLDSGIIVSTKGRNSSQSMEATAHRNKVARDYPIVVLVNEGSASAAEIVAGGLQDNKRALILGTRTFGKGSVQTILPLSDGSGLRLTTARYYTPSGRSIQLSGIEPDIELKFTPYEEKKDKEKPHAIREADLKGHMVNDALEGAPQKEKEEGKEKDDDVKLLLQRDNQVRHAMQLLQTWNIFSKIRPGQ
ncbi:MAG: S41 family peptidase [Desulfatiglandales bacterium]